MKYMDFNGLDSAFDVNPIYFWSYAHQTFLVSMSHPSFTHIYIYIYMRRDQVTTFFELQQALFTFSKSKSSIQTVRCDLYNKMCLDQILHFLEFFYYLLIWVQNSMVLI